MKKLSQFFKNAFVSYKKLDELIQEDNITEFAKHVINKKDAEQRISDGSCTLVYWACCCKSYNILLYLLTKNPDCNQFSGPLNWRPIDFFIHNKQYNLIQLLLLLSNTNVNLSLAESAKLTSLDMASEEVKKFILDIQNKKQKFEQLVKQYEILKNLGDIAYKNTQIEQYSNYYTQAIEVNKNIATMWENYANIEQEPILKAYYQKRLEQSLKTSEVLSSYTSSEGALIPTRLKQK